MIWEMINLRNQNKKQRIPKLYVSFVPHPNPEQALNLVAKIAFEEMMREGILGKREGDQK